MDNKVLYPADAVLNMLMIAYKMGFESPLEMSEEICKDIIMQAKPVVSDLSLMKCMVERTLQSSHKAKPIPAKNFYAKEEYGDD